MHNLLRVHILIDPWMAQTTELDWSKIFHFCGQIPMRNLSQCDQPGFITMRASSPPRLRYNTDKCMWLQHTDERTRIFGETNEVLLWIRTDDQPSALDPRVVDHPLPQPLPSLLTHPLNPPTHPSRLNPNVAKQAEHITRLLQYVSLKLEHFSQFRDVQEG